MYLRIFPIENGDIPASYVGLSEGMLNHLQKKCIDSLPFLWAPKSPLGCPRNLVKG